MNNVDTITLDNDGSHNEIYAENENAENADDILLEEHNEPQPAPFSEARMEYINKIQAYKESFPDSCALVDIKSLEYMDEDQLEEYLYRVRHTVSNRNSSNMIESGIDMAIAGLEVVGCGFFPSLKGLHSELQLNKAYHDTLKEIAIEHSNFGYVRPELRLLMIVGGAAVQRISADSGANETHTHPASEPLEALKGGAENAENVDEEKKEKYKDL